MTLNYLQLYKIMQAGVPVLILIKLVGRYLISVTDKQNDFLNRLVL